MRYLQALYWKEIIILTLEKDHEVQKKLEYRDYLWCI